MIKLLLAVLLFSVTALAGEQPRGPGIVTDHGETIGSYSTLTGGLVLTSDGGSQFLAWNGMGAYVGPNIIVICWCILYANERCQQWECEVWVLTDSGWMQVPGMHLEADEP